MRGQQVHLIAIINMGCKKEQGGNVWVFVQLIRRIAWTKNQLYKN